MHKKKNLYLIQSTDATIYGFKKNGIWERQRSTIEWYTKDYTVYYYTSDWRSYQDDLPPNAYHRINAVKTSFFGLRHLLFYAYLIVSSLKWRQTNGVIRIFGVNIPVTGLLKLISGKKMIVSYQYDWAEQTRSNYKNIKHYVSRSIEKSTLKNADFIICTMDWLYNKVLNFYRKSANECMIIPNYVDLKHFFPQEKEKWIVFAGRLHWSKGVDTLIKAFSKFHNSNSEYKLLIFGDGEERENLLKLAGNNPGIIFKGPTPILTYAATLRQSEIFVLPTITMEGHPKALIEAMACKCKCIASNAPGNSDVLTEADSVENIFTAKDEEALCQKLLNKVSINENVTYNFAVRNYSRDTLLTKETEILKRYSC